MLTVLVRDLVGTRRVVTGLLIIVVAIIVAGAVDLVVAPRIYAIAALASAILTTALLLNGYYRVDRLKGYVQLPVPPGRFLMTLALTVWAVVLLESVAGAIAFGVARGDLDGVLVAVMLLLAGLGVGATLLVVVGRRRPAGVLGIIWLVSAVPATVFLGPGHVLGLSILAVATTGAVLLTRQSYALLTPRLAGAVRGLLPNNYVLTVLVRERVTLVNGLVLLAFAIVFTVGAWEQGFPFAVGFGIVAVNSPLTTIVSGDGDLRVQLTMLGKPRGFFVQYGLVVGGYFALVNAAIVGCHLVLGTEHIGSLILLAVSATVLEAVGVPLLEDRFPITRGRTQRDVWRHPRKYLIPAILLAGSTLVIL